ncbi:MAG: hypothetical protein AAF723_05265 [Pseudomonadota bacterium]
MWIFFILASVSVAPAPQPIPSYDSCAALAEQDPGAGRAQAEAWMADGGGRPAKHCLALATLGLGSPASAGAILAELAEAERADPGVAARLYVQSAEAFMQAGRRDDALAALRETYKIIADAPEVHMAAATIYATAEEWEGVVLTLNALERYADLSADAFALRARAYVERGDTLKAAKDVKKALKLDPLLVDALVLRGELLQAGVKM